MKEEEKKKSFVKVLRNLEDYKSKEIIYSDLLKGEIPFTVGLFGGELTMWRVECEQPLPDAFQLFKKLDCSLWDGSPTKLFDKYAKPLGMASSLRLSIEQTEIFVNIEKGSPEYYAFIESLRPQWRKEAEEAFSLLKELIQRQCMFEMDKIHGYVAKLVSKEFNLEFLEKVHEVIQKQCNPELTEMGITVMLTLNLLAAFQKFGDSLPEGAWKSVTSFFISAYAEGVSKYETL